MSTQNMFTWRNKKIINGFLFLFLAEKLSSLFRNLYTFYEDNQSSDLPKIIENKK